MQLKPNRIPTFLPETQTYQNNIAAVGGSISMETLQALDRFVRDCYNAGIWSRLTEVYPIAGNDLTTALVKLKYAAIPSLISVNFVAGDYAERGSNGGLLGNGATKYLNTSFNHNQVAATAHMSAYVREDVSAVEYWIGSSNVSFFLLGSNSAGANAVAYHSSSTQAAMPASPTKGFYAGNRASATDLRIFKNGSGVGSNNTNTGYASENQNIYLFCRDHIGTPVNYSNKRLSFFSIGDSLTPAEHLLFYTAVQALQTHLQRNV